MGIKKYIKTKNIYKKIKNSRNNMYLHGGSMKKPRTRIGTGFRNLGLGVAGTAKLGWKFGKYIGRLGGPKPVSDEATKIANSIKNTMEKTGVNLGPKVELGVRDKTLGSIAAYLAPKTAIKKVAGAEAYQAIKNLKTNASGLGVKISRRQMARVLLRGNPNKAVDLIAKQIAKSKLTDDKKQEAVSEIVAKMKGIADAMKPKVPSAASSVSAVTDAFQAAKAKALASTPAAPEVAAPKDLTSVVTTPAPKDLTSVVTAPAPKDLTSVVTTPAPTTPAILKPVVPTPAAPAAPAAPAILKPVVPTPEAPAPTAELKPVATTSIEPKTKVPASTAATIPASPASPAEPLKPRPLEIVPGSAVQAPAQTPVNLDSQVGGGNIKNKKRLKKYSCKNIYTFRHK